MDTTRTARLFLGLNGVFSILTGVILLVIPGYVAENIFADKGGWQPIVLRIVGIGLLIFAFDLVTKARSALTTKKKVLEFFVMDIVWIVASILLLIFARHLFTGLGTLVIDIVAAFVAIFAVGQFIGARKMTMQ